MLDWLAHEHHLLFIVSAENHVGSALATDILRIQWAALSPVEGQDTLLWTIHRGVRERRIRPPAEAANVLTIGAIADDAAAPAQLGAGFLPFDSQRLPVHFSAFGLGYRRMIKPEFFVSGGRLPVRPQIPENRTTASFDDMHSYHRAAGVRVATPGASGNVDDTICIRGTSFAAALTTRAAVHLWDVLESLNSGATIPAEYFPELLKAALVHGATWRAARADLRRALADGLTDEKIPPARATPHRFWRTRFCSSRGVRRQARDPARLRQPGRGCGARIRVPLPQGLSGRIGLRRVTATLANFSPINPRSQKYLAANLWMTFGLKRTG